VTPSLILTTAVAVAVGAIVAWLLMRASGARHLAEATAAQAARLAAAEARLAEAHTRSADLAARLGTRDHEVSRLQSHASALSADKARLEGDVAAAADRNALLQSAEQQLRDAFRALASEALQQNADAVLRLARATLGEMQTRTVADLDKRQQSISELVRPLADTLQQVDSKLGAVEKDRVTSTARP